MAVAPISASDLAYIGKHPRAVVKAQKPRLKVVKSNQKRGLPVCTVGPAITGTVAVGQVLTCSPGTWQNAPTFAYQWRHNKANIPGAAVATFTLTATQTGYPVECAVTATNGQGSVVTNSNVVHP
jgi:hypothetical protein